MAPRPRPLYDRWIEKVEKTDTCWIWTGAISTSGYGVLQRGCRGEGLIRAHRFAYEHFVGPIPKGLDMRHSCHERRCVNPDHLTPGTRAENMADMMLAGRYELNGPRIRNPMRGSEHPSALFTDEQVVAIRADPRGSRRIARSLGVNRSSVARVRRGLSYKTAA